MGTRAPQRARRPLLIPVIILVLATLFGPKACQGLSFGTKSKPTLAATQDPNAEHELTVTVETIRTSKPVTVSVITAAGGFRPAGDHANQAWPYKKTFTYRPAIVGSITVKATSAMNIQLRLTIKRPGSKFNPNGVTQGSTWNGEITRTVNVGPGYS